jgi:4-diphosphocytidyl-2-C-methyl-D-erythritol kinase
VAKNMCNTLERVVEKIHPEIKEIKNILQEHNALNFMMTGSGSAVFGLFKNETSMETAHDALKKKYPYIYKTKTINRGISIE